jgi:hypothetical protein
VAKNSTEIFTFRISGNLLNLGRKNKNAQQLQQFANFFFRIITM